MLKITIYLFLKNKIFSFGCFNNFLKISDETIKMWAKILSKFENSRLVLKNSVSADKNYKKYLIKKFENRIDENRIFILNYEKKKKTFGALFKYRFKP